MNYFGFHFHIQHIHVVQISIPHLSRCATQTGASVTPTRSSRGPRDIFVIENCEGMLAICNQYLLKCVSLLNHTTNVSIALSNTWLKSGA